MRILVATLLASASFGLVVAAQPPGGPGESSYVIRPKGTGAGDAAPDKEPLEKSGFIIIRPNGKAATTVTTQSTDPKQPPTPATQPSTSTPGPGVLNVPPPEKAADLQEKDSKPLFDYWFAVGIEGQRAGYVNWSGKQKERNEKPFYVGTRLLNLSLSRFGQPVSLFGEETNIELPDGTVLMTTMRQGIGKDQALVLHGEVKLEEKKLKVRREGAVKGETEIAWPEGVVGLVREPRLFKELNLKVGESFDYPSYVSQVNWVVKATLTFEGEESKALWPNTPPRKLLRYSTKLAPLALPDGGKLKLPPSVTWVDHETFEPLMLECDFPSLGGQLIYLRTTKDAATAPSTRPPEIFNNQSIRLNREIPGIHQKAAVVYKVSTPKADEPEVIFSQDGRQQLKTLDAKARTFELHVSARRGPDRDATALAAPGKEFLESNYFINWDNQLVKAHAAGAVAGLPTNAGAWEKAAAVEQWVKRNMTAFEFDQAMATADNVARTLRGDCTEYAMLAAAMCRAVGVPSRTALGVVYAPARDGKASMAFHMWFEVFANGQWLPLDATLGFGGIGPGHIKITDHSWYEEKSFAPLLPVLRAQGAKVSMEVLKVEP
jgi:hypothetical protein